MIRVDFPESVDIISVDGLWQHDYGQMLEVSGLNLPSVCFIDFSIIEKDGEAIRVEAVTDSDSVTRALIPDSLLAYEENEGMDYKIYAFIYVTDTDAGETLKKIKMKVKARPRHDGEDEPIDRPLLDGVIETIKGYADAAIESKDIAIETKERAEEIAQEVFDARKTVEDTKTEVEILYNRTTEHKEDAFNYSEVASRHANTAMSYKNTAEEYALKSASEFGKAQLEAEKSSASATKAETALNALVSGIENGEFKGEQGDKGNDGKTPVKGIDYFTTSDKREITEQVKTDLQPAINNIESIAKGANNSKVFDTLSEARNWIVTNGSSVNIGTSFYIREQDVPDYWWDGTQLLPLETQKVILDGYAKLTDIPKKIASFEEDSNHRTVTDTEKNVWNAKSDFSGSYNDLSDKPSIPKAIIVDSALSGTSENPVQNKAITKKLNGIKEDYSQYLRDLNKVKNAVGDVPDGQNLSNMVSGKADADKVYTKTEIDNKLLNYVEYVSITIDCKGTDNSTPKPVTITVLEEGSGEVYQTLLFNGTPVTCRVPKGFAYIIKGSDDLDNYYSPVSAHGEALEAVSVVIKYSVLGIIESFADIQKVVQVGKAKNVFAVEEQIEVDTNGDFGKLQFDIVDFDNTADEETPKTMELLLHDVLYGYQLNSLQALGACTKGLAAGTYHFNLPTTYDSWTAGDYQFTITRDIPEGGQFKLSTTGGNSTAITAMLMQTFESPTQTAIMEMVAITSGTGGADLGKLGDGYAKYNGVFLNHWQRCAYGSNNYEQSALDQWLNASGANWWIPKCMFDRPPSYVNQVGFLGQLEPEFVDVLSETTVKCHTNTVYESPDAPHPISTLYEIKRKIFLASRMEVFGSAESAALTDGSKIFEYYKTRTQNADRIKYDHDNKTSARYWWLRTPTASSANSERVCGSSGALDYSGGSNGVGAVPACQIS